MNFTLYIAAQGNGVGAGGLFPEALANWSFDGYAELTPQYDGDNLNLNSVKVLRKTTLTVTDPGTWDLNAPVGALKVSGKSANEVGQAATWTVK